MTNVNASVWNYAGPKDDNGLSNEATFSTSIPYMTVNGKQVIDYNALYEKLQSLINYAINGDQADYNTQLDLGALLMNIGSIWSQLSSSQQGGLSTLLNPPGSPSVLTEMGPDILAALIHGDFYANNGNQSATNSQVNALIEQMKQAFGGIPVFANFLAKAESMQAGLTGWMNQHTSSTGTADESWTQWVSQQTLNWETDFTMLNSNDSSNTLTNEMMHNFIEMLLQGITDPWEIMAILFCDVFTGMNSNFQTQLGGLANLTDAVTNIGTQAENVQSEFNDNAGHFTGTTAMQFFNDMGNLNDVANSDLRINGTIGSSTQQAYNDICDPNSSVVVPYTDPTTGAKLNVPIGQLYQSALNGTPLVVNGVTYNAVTPANFAGTSTSGLNSLSTSTAQGQIAPAGYTQWETDFGQINTAVSAKSSAVGEIVSNLEATITKFEALMTAGASSMVDPEKAMEQASASAGS